MNWLRSPSLRKREDYPAYYLGMDLDMSRNLRHLVSLLRP